jgi:hypothetical protein
MLNNVTRISGDWFPAGERDAAVAVSLLFVAAGSVFISLYAPIAVTAPAQVSRLFSWQVPAWVAIMAAALAFTGDEPPAPPSAGAAVQRAARRGALRRGAAAQAAGAPPTSALATVAAHAFALCRHGNFMLLNLSSGLLTGLVYALCTCIGQLMSPCGDSNDAAGAALAALSALSTVGVVIYLYMLRGPGGAGGGEGDDSDGAANERSAMLPAPASPSSPSAAALSSAPAAAPVRHPYVAHQVGWSLATCAGIGVVLAVTRGGVPQAAVVAAWGVLGLFSGTLLNGALTMEHAAEMTFPLPANVSVAILSVTSSVVSFLQVVAATALLQARASAACVTAATPFAAFTAGTAAVGLACCALLRPEYRRAEVEEAATAALRCGKGGGGGGAGAGALEGREMPRTDGGGAARQGYGAMA